MTKVESINKKWIEELNVDIQTYIQTKFQKNHHWLSPEDTLDISLSVVVGMVEGVIHNHVKEEHTSNTRIVFVENLIKAFKQVELGQVKITNMDG